jgi:hypothetical protein
LQSANRPDRYTRSIALLRQRQCRAERKLTFALAVHQTEVEEFGESLDKRLDLLAFFSHLPRLLAIQTVKIQERLCRSRTARSTLHWFLPVRWRPSPREFDEAEVPSVRQQLLTLSRKLLVFPLLLGGGWFDACREPALA